MLGVGDSSLRRLAALAVGVPLLRSSGNEPTVCDCETADDDDDDAAAAAIERGELTGKPVVVVVVLLVGAPAL